jgi:hypothetical protein
MEDLLGLRRHAAALAAVWKFNRPPRLGCSDWVRYSGLSKSALEESSPFDIRHRFAVIFITVNCFPANRCAYVLSRALLLSSHRRRASRLLFDDGVLSAKRRSQKY